MASPNPTEVSLHERLPATVRSIAIARGAARRFASDLDVDLDGVVLAVSEAVANVVAHAYDQDAAGTVELSGWAAPHEVTIAIQDRGHGLQEGAATGGAGFGLEIIRRVARQVELVDSPDGVALTMRFRRGGPGSAR